MFGDPLLNPHNYQKSQIGEVINIIGGSQPSKKFFKSEALPGYIRLVQIRDYKTDKYLTFVPKTSTKKFCSKDDIMIGRYGPPVFQILRGIEGAYNVALMKATPKKELINEYVFYLLSCNYIQDIIIANSQRTAGQTGVNLKLLNSIEIIVPPLHLQNQFAECVQVIDTQKAQAQASLEKAEELFNSLLQRAFKGELM
jgi:type I restriction enzyme S subunit